MFCAKTASVLASDKKNSKAVAEAVISAERKNVLEVGWSQKARDGVWSSRVPPGGVRIFVFALEVLGLSLPEVTKGYIIVSTSETIELLIIEFTRDFESVCFYGRSTQRL